MLNQVPIRSRQAARLVTLRHPNNMPCTIFRKKVTRASTGKSGGRPTLGGAMVLSSEDEDDFEWKLLGEGRVLFMGPFEGIDLVRRGDALEQQSLVQASIEFVQQPQAGLPGEGAPDLELVKNDVIYAVPGQGVVLPWEIVSVIGNINIPPYARRFVLNARDDLNYLEAEQPGG